MYPFSIGVMADSFRVPMNAAMIKAKRVGARGIQIYTTRGEYAPENMTARRISEIRHMLCDNGLVLSATCGDIGRPIRENDKKEEVVQGFKRMLDLAKELGTNIVTTHIGVVPANSNHRRYKVMQEICFELAQYATSLEAFFAVETGPETSLVLKGFLDSLQSKGLGVNLDPANLVMVTGDDPVKAVYNLKDYIVHTHAKDGIKLLDRDPEVIYSVIEDAIQEGEAFKEVPLGEGSVDFTNYFKALYDIGFKGFLTIEREVGDDPEKDIACAVEFLKGHIG